MAKLKRNIPKTIVKQPIQPVGPDQDGVVRFQPNAIVQYLLDNGGIDLNKLAELDFSNNDREQFAQLIGYSLSGFSDLSYVSDETYEAAEKMHKTGVTDAEARAIALREQLEEARGAMRDGIARLYGIHPDDLVL